MIVVKIYTLESQAAVFFISFCPPHDFVFASNNDGSFIYSPLDLAFEIKFQASHLTCHQYHVHILVQNYAVVFGKKANISAY